MFKVNEYLMGINKWIVNDLLKKKKTLTREIFGHCVQYQRPTNTVDQTLNTHVKPHFPNFKIKFSPLQFHFLCLPNDCLLRIVSRIDNQTNSMSLKDLEANAIDEEAIKKRDSETYP